MNPTTTLILLCSLVLVGQCISGVGLNPIRPLQMNKGYQTLYMFFINPEEEILTKAGFKITFPAEFDYTAIASNLNCMASSLSYSWITVPCVFAMYAFINLAILFWWLLEQSKMNKLKSWSPPRRIQAFMQCLHTFLYAWYMILQWRHATKTSGK